MQQRALVYCSRGHRNASENRFCLTCGEKLPVQLAAPQALLGDRYRIVHELGQGGFGRTYLAEDINRFNETCVLKEFAPQVQGSTALQKAEELFEREAGVLYSLQHPQIPRFRELFRASLAAQDRLFLVQDFVEGRTYRQLLEARRPQNLYFSELDIRQLFEQILPVLRYIHQAGVIHRDISPDNLILRSIDQLPVLIDFGGVKQLAAAATSKYTDTPTAPVTRLGKVGYAPVEQMYEGIVSPESDLYALAVTALVLMTGKEPAALIDPTGRTHPWQSNVTLSPDFAAVLTKMLASRSADRLPSAQAVLQALGMNRSLPDSPASLPINTADPTQALGAAAAGTPGMATPGTVTSGTVTSGTGLAGNPSTMPVAPIPRRSSRRIPPLLLLLLPLVLLTGLAWGWRDRWLPLFSQLPHPAPVEPGQTDTLEGLAGTANVDYGFLVKLTDATFRKRYPDQADRVLSDGEADAKWRKIWAEIAEDWLTQLPQILSTSARQKLGSYSNADRDQWKQTINQRYVGSRSLYDLTDAKFFALFPEQRDQEFLQQPIGQVWYGIAADQVDGLQEGRSLERIEFAEGAFSAQKSDSLEVGAGRVYIANLGSGQIMRLNLQIPEKSGLLSIYLPRPTQELPVLLEDSSERTWTGTLPQSGYYEIVVVNTIKQPISYQLNLAVDNVTANPVAPDQGEAPESKD